MRKESPELTAHKRALGRQLAALREAAEIGQQQVARRTGYSRPSVSHAEGGRQLLTREFWKVADELLKADGVLLAEYEQVRASKQANDARCREEELAAAYAEARALRAATSPYPIQDRAGMAAVVEDADTTGAGPGEPPALLGEVTKRSAASSSPLRLWLLRC